MGDEPTFSACLNWKLFAFGNREKIAPACLLTFSFSFPVLKVVPSDTTLPNLSWNHDGLRYDLNRQIISHNRPLHYTLIPKLTDTPPTILKRIPVGHALRIIRFADICHEKNSTKGNSQLPNIKLLLKRKVTSLRIFSFLKRTKMVVWTSLGAQNIIHISNNAVLFLYNRYKPGPAKKQLLTRIEMKDEFRDKDFSFYNLNKEVWHGPLRRRRHGAESIGRSGGEIIVRLRGEDMGRIGEGMGRHGGEGMGRVDRDSMGGLSGSMGILSGRPSRTNQFYESV
ncbi:hypothetical protein Tco_0868980 [Tanacetum coccineum]